MQKRGNMLPLLLPGFLHLIKNCFTNSELLYAVMLLFHGYTIDVFSTLTDFGQSLFSAAFWARIPTNLIDKMIAVYIAYGIFRLIRRPDIPYTKSSMNGSQS